MLFNVKRYLAALLIIATIITPLGARAETQVTADLDREEMDPNDLVTLTVNVITDGDADVSIPEQPDLPEFSIVQKWSSTQAQSSFTITSQGPVYQTRMIRSYKFALQPMREGNLTVRGIPVEVDGRRYMTRPMTVSVVTGGSPQVGNGGRGGGNRGRGGSRGRGGNQPVLPPGFPPDLFDDEDDLFAQLLRRQGALPSTGGFRSIPKNDKAAFFVQVEIDKASVYQDEQVTASWYLYTRGQIRDIDTLKYPSLRGFWKEDIEIATQLNFQQEVINGVPYRKALLASFALFPIKPGTAVVDEYKVRCSVMDTVDPFGIFAGGQTRQYTKSSEPVRVTVKPLPVEGRPADFSGAVGSYQVSARVDDPNVTVGEPFSFRIRFEGKGNAKRIDLPPLPLPEGLELYETQKEAKFFRTGTSYRDFNLLLIPRNEGEIVIPPISVSVFDPQQGKYVTTATEEIRVRAKRGMNSSKTENSRLAGKKKREKAEDREPEIEVEYEAGPAANTSTQTIGFSVTFALIALILLVRARVELGWGQRKRDLQRRLQARFRKIDERLQKSDWRGVGAEVTNTVYYILGEISGQGGATVELEKLMLQAPPSVRRELAEPLMKLMDSFQALSFAPDEIVSTLKEPAQVKKLVAEMRLLMEKAVALGVNGEQDGGYATGPKAS